MKKIFIFIFLLFSLIFFSSCHDDGLSGIIDKSELPAETYEQKIASILKESEEEAPTNSRLEELMRNNPNLRKVVDLLNSSARKSRFNF